MKISIVKNILSANERFAEQNRAMFRDKGILVVNLMSSPGAGKTTLLEAMGQALATRLKIGVIEGDIQTAIDAERVAAAGLQAVQIETEGACHLDAGMVRDAAGNLDLEDMDLLVVENVGNLVCPAEFDVGENFKVMLLSVTEGDDKPLKYPLMFRQCRALCISKIDLLPYLRCDIAAMRQAAISLNPDLKIFEISAYTGQGLDEWHQWLLEQAGTGM